jgi:hypothetical protein
MISQLAYAFKYVMGKDVAGRDFHVHTDDTFLVSYPKSGSTWTRFLLAALVNPKEEVNFRNIDRLLPSSAGQSKKHLRSTPRPRLIKSHEYFDVRYQNVIYVVRDPRDVVLSQYRFFLKRKKIQDGYSMDLYVNRFVAGDLNPWGSWGENVGSWLVAQHGPKRFLLLRYEDMLQQTAQELAKVADFMQLQVTPEHLERCVALGSADRMRELEKNSSGSVVAKGRKDVPFVGAAKAGGWKAGLTPEHVAKIEAAWGPLMKHLGYELASTSAPTSSKILDAIVTQPTR